MEAISFRPMPGGNCGFRDRKVVEIPQNPSMEHMKPFFSSARCAIPFCGNRLCEEGFFLLGCVFDLLAKRGWNRCRAGRLTSAML